MNNIKKVICLAIICILITAICFFIGTKFKNKSNINGANGQRIEEEPVSKMYETEPIKDFKKAYNIDRFINNALEYIYDENFKSGFYEMSNSHYNISTKLQLNKYERKFYTKNAYELNLNENITAFFIQGYTIYRDIDSITEDIKREDINFTIMKVNNKCYIDLYGMNYTDVFKYNENISDTVVWESAENQIDKLIDDSSYALFSDEFLQEEILDADFAYWFYEDYKNNKLFSDQDKDYYKNTELKRYVGNYEEGFTLTDSQGSQIYIQPGNIPMEYEVSTRFGS